MAESAKRATAKSQFTRVEKRLEEAIKKAPSIPYQTIERRYEDLREKYNAAQQAHDDYVQALLSSKTDTTQAEEEKWIDELTQRYDDIEERVDILLVKMKQDDEAKSNREIAIKDDENDSSRQFSTSITSSQQPANTLQLARSSETF